MKKKGGTVFAAYSTHNMWTPLTLLSLLFHPSFGEFATASVSLVIVDFSRRFAFTTPLLKYLLRTYLAQVFAIQGGLYRDE